MKARVQNAAMATGQPQTSAGYSPYELPEEPTPRSRLDEAVFTQWKKTGITPARRCTDAVFLRRAYLALTGTVPSADEAKTFLASENANGRAELIDSLLVKPEYAEYWAMRWCDVLRVKSEFPINLWPNAAQAYHRWVLEALQKNMPYDRMAWELLTQTGSNFRVPPVNFYRAVQSRDPEALARAVALTFMGTRVDRWPKQRLLGMAAFFGNVAYKSTREWKEEIVFFDPTRSWPALKGVKPVFPDGTPARIPPGSDPRIIFAKWLISPHNPWFTKCAVNRVWYWLFGQGLIQEPDDIRPDNPPAIPEALTYLERFFIASRYDLKALLRAITSSEVFQLAPVRRTRSTAPAAAFAAYPIHRLEAEVLIDAINKVTGSSEEYSSPIPEPFTFVPPSERTIALADGSITSTFLELFGRPPRDTGTMDERNSAPTAAQRLHLLNSSHIQNKIRQSTMLRDSIRWSGTSRQAVSSLYLTILCRPPSEPELAAAVEYIGTSRPDMEKGLDIAWALINTAEFQYQH